MIDKLQRHLKMDDGGLGGLRDRRLHAVFVEVWERMACEYMACHNGIRASRRIIRDLDQGLFVSQLDI